MELILKFDLDKRTVRHALNVAAFATEMATQLALKERDGEPLSQYFAEMSDEELLSQLGESPQEELAPEVVEQKRRALFAQGYAGGASRALYNTNAESPRKNALGGYRRASALCQRRFVLALCSCPV